MTELLVVLDSEPSEETSALKNNENQIEPQRSDEDDGFSSNPEKRESYIDDDDDDDDDDYEDRGDGSLADDEDDGCDDLHDSWTSEKARQVFTPTVMIVKPASNEEDLNESSAVREEIEMEKVPLQLHNFNTNQSERFHPQWIDEIEKPKVRCCGEILKLCICFSCAAVIFPVFTWGGYELLPIKTPPLNSTPIRLLYALRCAFFAVIPIVLGVLVQGVSRLKFRSLKPLIDGMLKNRELGVHGHYVRESLHLYLLYFLQLAVMATYVQQEVLKLVPLLTIIFVIGRLIYWVCAAFGSSVRALGFGLSFLPLLPLLGANIYFICSADGQEVLFDVAPPTTAPPRPRFWG